MTTRIDVDEVEFRRRYERGDELRDMAQHFRIGVTKVRLLRNDLGLPLRNPTVSGDTMAGVRKMLDDGASFNEIARTLPISVMTLTRKFPGQGWTQQQTSEFRILLKRYGDGV